MSSCASRCEQKSKRDWFLWTSLTGVILFYTLFVFFADHLTTIMWLHHFAAGVYDLMNTMWWGLFIGFIMVSIVSKVPREFIMSILGQAGETKGIFRATFAGVFLDLCNHGILMVGAKLYERGASIGQVIAFLLASPWNSLSLTVILIALIGLPWTIGFIALSMIIGVITGLIFDGLVRKGTLPANPNHFENDKDFLFWQEAKKGLKSTDFNLAFFKSMALQGISDSKMVAKWLFFGVLLASLIRATIDAESFAYYLGPTALGLWITIIFATILEVCSEGSTPIAADIVNRAASPGNGFSFLMSGAATDYTEIMVMKETTTSWKIALFIPLITLPQVILVAWLINQFS